MSKGKKTKTNISQSQPKQSAPQLRTAGAEEGKNIRAPIGQEENINKMSQKDRVRMAMGKQATLDLSFYNSLPEYQGKTLFWENDQNGQVEKWLQLGAELVKRRSSAQKEFKGVTDKSLSEWESRPVGPDGSGGKLVAYALSLDSDDYHALRIAPKEARQEEIMEALGAGKANLTEKVMPGVTGLKTYAPNLPTGGKGLEIIEKTHDI